MAKYEITHSCGTKRTIQLFGKREERERKIEWLESQPCPEVQNEAAEKEAKAQGLVVLEGSEKQVAWANTIRCEALEEIGHRCGLKNIFRALGARGYTDKSLRGLGITDQKTFERFCDKVKAMALGNTSANWWIDNRSCAAHQAIAEALDTLAPSKN